MAVDGVSPEFGSTMNRVAQKMLRRFGYLLAVNIVVVGIALTTLSLGWLIGALVTVFLLGTTAPGALAAIILPRLGKP